MRGQMEGHANAMAQLRRDRIVRRLARGSALSKGFEPGTVAQEDGGREEPSD